MHLERTMEGEGRERGKRGEGVTLGSHLQRGLDGGELGVDFGVLPDEVQGGTGLLGVFGCWGWKVL